MDKSERLVLIVEEDQDLSEILGIVLSASFCTEVAHSLLEADSLIKKNHPPILYINDMLPDGSGIEYVSRLRVLDKATYIVIMASPISKSLKDRAIEAGANAFLEKPFSLAELRKSFPS